MLASVVLPTSLIDEHAITLATWGLVFVTLLLVIATFVLWYDSFQKGKEQRDRWRREDEQHKADREEERARWKREDALRDDEQKPKYSFGVETGVWNNQRRTITMWCANLGLIPFHVGTVSMKIVCPDGHERDVLEFFANRLVKSGEQIQIGIPHNIFQSLVLTKDLELSLSVSTAYFVEKSSPQAYSFFVSDGWCSRIREGYYESRRVMCECGATGFFDPNGLRAELDVVVKLNEAQRELVASCPQHFSTVLRSVVDVDGRTKRFINA